MIVENAPSHYNPQPTKPPKLVKPPEPAKAPPEPAKAPAKAPAPTKTPKLVKLPEPAKASPKALDPTKTPLKTKD